MQSPGAIGLRFQHLCKFGESRHRHVQCLGKVAVGRGLRVRLAADFVVHLQPQVARRFFKFRSGIGQRRIVLRRSGGFHPGVAPQFDELMGGNRFAEEQTGGFGQLVRLVEDHGVARGQQFRHALVTQDHVGEKQMVVHHHHIRFHRLLARLHDEALLVIRAIAAEAVLACRGHVRPDGRVLRHFGQSAAIAGLAGPRVGLDARQIRHVVAVQEAAIVLGALQVVMADIVRPTLEQRHRHRRLQRIAHHRDVAAEQLVLQGLGTGGDDHLATLGEGRHQIGERLAGTRTCLGDQDAAPFDRLLDRPRHFHLLRTQAVAGNGRGKRAGIGKELFELQFGVLQSAPNGLTTASPPRPRTSV